MNKEELNSKGFTFIELVVVMAIFLFIIGAAIIIFISIIENQRNILSEIQLLNQASYAEEYMSKALRMAKRETIEGCLPNGYIYLLTRYDGVGLYKGIKFLNQSVQDSLGNPLCQEFFVDSDGVLKETTWSGESSTAPVALISANLNLKSVIFSVNGLNIPGNPPCSSLCGASIENPTDPKQPRVTIVLKAQPGGEDQPVRIFQTTVSQRNLNLN